MREIGRNIYIVEGEEWVSPFNKFDRRSTAQERQALDAWRWHYERLGVRTIVVGNELLVNVEDDQRVWPREYDWAVV